MDGTPNTCRCWTAGGIGDDRRAALSAEGLVRVLGGGEPCFSAIELNTTCLIAGARRSSRSMKISIMSHSMYLSANLPHALHFTV